VNLTAAGVESRGWCGCGFIVYHYRPGTVFDDAPLHHGLLHDDRARLDCRLDDSGDEARDRGLAVAVTGEGGSRRA
jgi:hypothetical protein